MPPDLALFLTLIGSNYLCLELIFMDPKVFESLKFDCILLFKSVQLDTSKRVAISFVSLYYKRVMIR